MDPSNSTENLLKVDHLKDEDSTYIEVDVPYSLFEYINGEDCNIQNICRICLSTNNEVLYPLVSTKEDNFLADMLTTVTNLEITPEDGLPLSICELCQNVILQFYEFKLKCEKSDCMLRSILKGEFIAKEEPPDGYIPAKEVADGDNQVNILNDEMELVEDVQYLENLSDDANDDDKLYIAQDTCKKKRKNINTEIRSSKRPKNILSNTSVSGSEVIDKYSNSFQCNQCSKVFPQDKALITHIAKKHRLKKEKRPYPCGQCKESFESEHDLDIHSMLHSSGNEWKCNKCNKEFNSKTTLRRHIQRHMQFKAHVCSWCDKAFSELSALRKHVRVHTGQCVEKKHVCHICDKRYSDSSLLSAHVSRHSGARPFPCASCNKRFTSRRLLASHSLVHTDTKPYACIYCDRRFRHESTRNTHHRTHTGERPYICSVCGKNFIQICNLTLHMRTHTGERPYSCTMCDRKFTSGPSLKSHLATHTGERPCSCSVCGKRFTRKNLVAHMRLHSGERPFACTVCPKKFVNASRLRDHCRTHTGEKPYECAYCTLTFTTKPHLVKHMKSHDPPKKKTAKREPSIKQVPSNPTVTKDVNKKEKQELGTIENPIIEHSEKDITLDIVQEVPLEVTGELILQDDSNYQINTDDICLNDTMNISDDVSYSSDVNLVTVNEGGVSISASNLEGSTVKLYQLDQSLVQIHSSGGQVTISKITSKMTANF